MAEATFSKIHAQVARLSALANTTGPDAAEDGHGDAGSGASPPHAAGHQSPAPEHEAGDLDAGADLWAMLRMVSRDD